MNKVLYIFTCIILLATSSCIGWGLEELPAFEEAEIKDFDFEYRYVIKNANGVEQMAVIKLITAVEFTENSISNTITIPEPSGTFTEEIASQISLSNIIGYAEVSIAAHVKPIGSAPILGTIGDYSEIAEYEVKAADGTIKVWSVTTKFAD